MKYQIIEKNTEDHWLELEGTNGACIIDGNKEIPIYNRRVVCKWDGCIDYRDYCNGYGWDHKCDDDCQCCQGYIHICNIDEMIEELKEIKRIAIEFYKGKSGEEYWSEEAHD